MLLSFKEKVALALIITDITERNLVATLQDNNNYKNRLLASVSHELRTPLNSSINFISMAIEDSNIPNYIKENYLTKSLISSKLLLHLINDILDFSQMTAKKLRLCYEMLDVRDTIEQCCNLVRLQAARKGLHLETQWNVEVANSYFCTDHNRLKQIILNLLSNALKFTIEGKISVLVELKNCIPSEEVDRAEITPRKILHISVKDTGIGMTPEDQLCLFKAFEKIDLSDRAPINSTGVGLGLVISNNLVLMLNSQDNFSSNSISVESEKDVGTKFSFSLLNKEVFDILTSPKPTLNSEMINTDDIPEETDSANTLMASRAPEFQTLATTKRTAFNSKNQNQMLSEDSSVNRCSCAEFLVVDDDIFNISTIETLLHKLRYKCDPAFNGRQAVEKVMLRKNEPCSQQCMSYKAIFMDCSMPIMDGFTASAILRDRIKNSEIPEVPIIACTAFAHEKEIQRALECGMSCHLIKPLTLEAIDNAIKRINKQQLLNSK